MQSDKHPIDELFKKSLDGHRMVPSENARYHFLEEARKLPVINRSRRKRGWVISILSLTIITSITLYLTYQQQGLPTQSSNEKTHGFEKIRKDQPAASLPGIKDTGCEKIQPAANGNTVSTPESNISITRDHITTKESQVTNQSLVDPLNTKETVVEQSDPPVFYLDENAHNPDNTPLHHESTDMSEQPSESIVPVVSILRTDSLPGLAENMAAGLILKADLNADPDDNPKPKQDFRLPGRLQFAAGVEYTPEWMFNTIEGDKFVNNAGLEVTISSGRFSVRTGLGISISKGVNELSVAYNDYLGSYNHLDSMDFTWNEPVHNYLPTFYMTRKDVWDSLLKLDYPKLTKQYFYLQVPLIMGYNVIQTDKFHLGFRVGPILSVLLASKQLSEDYDPGLKKIVSINNIPPEQVNLNWQAMFGINSSLRAGGSSRIELEPFIRYYFNSVYEKPSQSMKPWSAGLRVAFLFGW